ncbi:hypothetical protein [Sinisalibacter aestuarii]|uniref:Tetratricopeptide repeat protein n=1 Tax=Sinisalibacter aestuarii TaxID=2949426 RepID=A0ABQ5LVN4_9RHOB|nr:hypothetical protein [Sinisalibacter aestuarii]GKY89042.1 hypothetical protein STA1M1_29110 [Sinisalibacter aestuarii]
MSNHESFIDEVTEEVRRDKLYGALRKYGWIGVVAVVLVVGGAAVNEWMKARDRAAAEAVGDAILAAVETEDAGARAEALAAVSAGGETAVLLGLIEAAEAGDPAQASETLAALAADPSLPVLYRDLAALKRAMLPGGVVDAETRLAALEPLTAPGGAFRVLAEEQMALAEIELGNTDAALARLQALLTDTEASGPLRQRATQLIVALGGDPAAAG